MRRGTGKNAASSSSNNAAHLMSTMNSAADNNTRVRRNTRSLQDKVESARRHLASHQNKFHAAEDSSGGESVENRSPHHRSRSSPRSSTRPDTTATTAAANNNKRTSSVLYSAELQHARRVSGEARKKSSPIKKPTRAATKSISPTRSNTSFHNQSLSELTFTSSPHRRSTFVVGGKRDSYRGDSTFTAARRETYTIDRRDDTTVSREETVIAPGLLEEEYRPRGRAHSHGSASVFHARCAPKDAFAHEVSNADKWEIDFLPGSLRNARRVEKDRRSAAADLLTPSAESVRYQEERTRREEEELKRLVREQTGGRSAKEIFDSWVPLDEERRKRKGGDAGVEEESASPRKSTRRVWSTDSDDDVIVGGGGRRDRGKDGRELLRRLERGGGGGGAVVVEDEAGYALPHQQQRDVDVVVAHHRHHARPLRTPSPALLRGPSPEDEQFFTPAATSAPRLSRGGGGEGRNEGETPVMGRLSTRLSTTFVMDRSPAVARGVDRLRSDAEADRSVGSAYHAMPDRGEESIQGGGGGELLGEYATPIGRRAARRGEEVEHSFLHSSPALDRSRLNESMHVFETNLNRSLEHLSSLADRLGAQLEQSRANLSAIGVVPTTPLKATTSSTRADGGLEGAAGERRLDMQASILGSLPPMREERHSMGGLELRRMMAGADRDHHRISLPEARREEEEEEELAARRHMSPIPPPAAARRQAGAPPTAADSAGLASLLDANLGRMERAEAYESEAARIEGVVAELNQTAAKVDEAVRSKPLPTATPAPPVPPPRLSRAPAPPPPPLARDREPPMPRPRSPLLMEQQPVAAAVSSSPPLALAIDSAGGREELMEMYEARHRNWHRRADDIAVPSPRSPMSRSPSPLPLALANPAELRERQSVQGMLNQRAKAVRGPFLHLLQRLYRARFERRYDEKKRRHGDAAFEREFAAEQQRQEASFRREAAEAKARATDGKIRYRDFMQWMKEESERIEEEIACEVDRRERKRWEWKVRAEGADQSLLDSSRLAEASALLDERARKALRARERAQKHVEKREHVRRLESEARRAVALAEIPSSARSSIDDASFLLLNQSIRRYSIGNEPLRVSSARGGTPADMSLNASRDATGRSLNDSREPYGSMGGGGGRRREMMIEMKERLEEKRRQAEEVRRAMEESERRMTETEFVSVAAQLAAHDDYIRGVERVGRVIAENVEPRTPSGLPAGVEPLDLSSLKEAERKEEDEKELNSAEKSTDLSGKMYGVGLRSPPISADSLDVSITSIAQPGGSPPEGRRPAAAAGSSRASSSQQYPKSTTSAASSSPKKTPLLPSSGRSSPVDVPKEEEQEKATVPRGEERPEEEDEDTVANRALVFSPLIEELDRSLPSTAASTGRQELTVPAVAVSVPVEAITVPVEEITVPPVLPEWTTVRTLEPVILRGPPVDTVGSGGSSSRQEFSPLASAERENTVGGPVTVEWESGESRDEEEEERLERSTASLRKAISVASEMANPFDGFESGSSGKSGGEEPLWHRPAVVEQMPAVVTPIPTAPPTTAASTAATTTVAEQPPPPLVEREQEQMVEPSAVTPEATTVVAKSQERDEDEELSWGYGGGELEVGGDTARSADFDWGIPQSQKKAEVKEIEKPHKEEEEKEKVIEVEKTHGAEEKDVTPKGRIASLRDRLNRMNLEDEEEEEERGSEKKTSTSSSTTTTSSSRSTASSTTTMSTEKTMSEENGAKKGEEEDKTPRVPSVSGGASSASGSVDFDSDVRLPDAENVSARSSARTPSRSRFRLSLDDSFPDSPRDATSTVRSVSTAASSSFFATARTLAKAAGSPRTPTSPRTPRGTLPAHLSPSSGAASPEARMSRFNAVMPMSPRSGRRSTSPKPQVHSLSRELSFAQDDSSLGDISRLSAVELAPPSSSGFPPILGALAPPLAAAAAATTSAQLQPMAAAAAGAAAPMRPPPMGGAAALDLSSLDSDSDDRLEESVYDLMEIQTQAPSVLASLPIAELIGEPGADEEEEGPSPLTLTARSSQASLHDMMAAMEKEEFIHPRIEREAELIWSVFEQKGSFTKEDARAYADADLEMDASDVEAIRNERIRLIRGVSAEVAASLCARDVRRTSDGRSIPREIVPLRRRRPAPLTRPRLVAAIKQQMTPSLAPPFTTRMRALGVEYARLGIDERVLYADLYANEDTLFQSDLERAEIVEELLRM